MHQPNRFSNRRQTEILTFDDSRRACLMICLFAQIIELQPRYIQAVFRAIDERYGSFARYRQDALRLSDADVVELKSRLLE